MQITPTLIKLLDRAQNPRAIRAACWALERATGIKSTELVFSTGSGSADWYARNGYRLRGWSSFSSHAGKTISTDTALESSAYFAGVKLISEDLGSLPFFTYERSRDRKTIEKAYGHPLYRTLHDLWNPDIAAGEGVEALTAHALMYGNGYAEKQSTASTTYLWPWQPEQTRQDVDSRGNVVYLNSASGREKTYGRRDVFHLKGWSLDGIEGENILSRMRHVLGTTLASDEFVGRFFENDATPGVVIERPAGLPAMNAETLLKFKEAWKQWHQGLANSHEPAVLQDGMQIKKLAATNQEAQLLELRQFQIAEVCRILRLPPHKLSDLTRSTNNNIEHQGIEYVTNTIGPWVDRWRRSVYRCLLTTDEQLAGRVWAEMEINGLLRGDFATQAEGWRKLLEKGVFTINDVRRLINLNPIPEGDNSFVQLNLTTVQNVAAGMNLKQDQPGPEPVTA